VARHVDFDKQAIPTNDDDNQPPHRQAANYYKEQAAAQGGTYVVTMENPKPSAPETLVIEITGSKAKQKKAIQLV